MAPLALRFLIFIGYGLFLYALTFALRVAPGALGAFTLLILYGLGLGIAGQFAFDWHRRRSFLHTWGLTAAAMLVLCAVLVIFAAETLICVVVILPIALPALALGIWLTRKLLARFEHPPLACLSFLVLPLALTSLDLSQLNRAEIVQVTSSIEVAAPARLIRQMAENVSDIGPSERPWTVTHDLLGAPRPVSAVTGAGIRHATWSEGIRFEEHLLPGPDLAWTFVFPEPGLLRALDPRISPTGPEVTMLRGGYRFTPLGPSRTRVTLTTRYRLVSPINFYLKPWGRLFLDDFHMAVLKVIAARAEEAS